MPLAPRPQPRRCDLSRARWWATASLLGMLMGCQNPGEGADTGGTATTDPSPDDDSGACLVGSAGCDCYASGTCDPGLECVEGVCEELPPSTTTGADSGTDTASGTDTGTGTDAGTGTDTTGTSAGTGTTGTAGDTGTGDGTTGDGTTSGDGGTGTSAGGDGGTGTSGTSSTSTTTGTGTTGTSDSGGTSTSGAPDPSTTG